MASVNVSYAYLIDGDLLLLTLPWCVIVTTDILVAALLVPTGEEV